MPDLEIIRLVESLLTIIKTKNLEPQIDTHYITNFEFDDSNVTEFEGLSNNNLIVLETKLTNEEDSMLMRLFHSIIDNNFWYIDEIISSIECNDNIKLKLMSYDVETWYNILLDDMCEISSFQFIPRYKRNYDNPTYTNFNQTVIKVEDINMQMT